MSDENGNESQNEVINNDGVTSESQQQHESQELQPSVQYTDNMEQAKVDLAALKEHMVSNTATPTQKRQYRELTDFVHFKGKVPSHLVESQQAVGHLPYESETQDVISTYAPAQHVSEIKQYFDNVPESMDAGEVNGLRELAVTLELPAVAANTLIQNIIDHTSAYEAHGYDHIPQFENAEDLDSFKHKAIDQLGGQENFQAMGQKMLAYLEQTIPANLYQDIVNKYDNTSVALDANIILKLSSLYDARYGS